MSIDWDDDDEDDFFSSVDWEAQERILLAQRAYRSSALTTFEQAPSVREREHGFPDENKRPKLVQEQICVTLIPPCSSPDSSGDLDINPRVLVVANGAARHVCKDKLGTLDWCSWYPDRKGWTLPYSHYDRLLTCLPKNDPGVVVEPLNIVAASVLKHTVLVRDDSMRYRCIPADLEAQLMPFQREGVKFALRHGGKALLGDEMGLGKTVQALAVLSAYKDEWPVLVVSPSSLRESWSNAIQEWLGIPESKIRVIHTGKDAEQTRFGSFDFLVISFNFLDKMDLAGKFDVVVVDESHCLKDPSAKRTKAAMPILKQGKRCLLLTGTPALNRPKEIFTQLSCLVPKANLRLKDFGERYCTGNRFDKYGGAKNLDELHALLRNSIMIRRLKVDVLTQLPRKRRQQVYLALDTSSRKKLEILQQQMTEAKAAMSQLIAQAASSNNKNMRMSGEQRSVVMEIYKKTAELKAKCVQDYVDTLLEGGGKFLVFAHHTCLLDAIEHSCNKHKCKYIRIDGSTPSHSRANLVDSFQTNESVRVAILSIRAAGVGLTLTAASTVVFAEMTWTPGEIIQAEDRAHRIGQASSVNVYFLHIKNSIDDVIWSSLQSKLENLGQTLDGIDQNCLALASQGRTLPERGQTNLDRFLSQRTSSQA